MKEINSWSLTAVIGTAILLAAWAIPKAVGQSPDPQAAPQVNAEQQKQLDQLKAVEDQMQKDRDAVHAAITEFGWDSDQADAAQAKLFQTRSEYRRLRRSMRSQGMAVPPPAGLGRRGFRDAPGGEGWDGPGHGRRGGRGTGWGHHARGHCPCCGR